MAETILKNCRVYLDGRNLSGDMNEATLTYRADMQEKTVFTSSARQRKSGLKDMEFTAGGFWNASSSAGNAKADDLGFLIMGTTAVLTVLPPGSTTQGQPAYFTKTLAGEYAPGGSIGDMFGYSLSLSGDGQNLVRGSVFHVGTVSTGTTGYVKNLGPSNQAKKFHIAMHVLSLSSAGATVRTAAQASSSSGFAGANTLFNQAVTTADAGKSYWGSTAASSTKKVFYRVLITSSGSTTASAQCVITAGLK